MTNIILILIVVGLLAVVGYLFYILYLFKPRIEMRGEPMYSRLRDLRTN